MDIKAVILAGGRGKRLRPLTDSIPKPMILLDDYPVLLHVINYFKKYQVRNFIISLGYKSESVISYFGSGKKFGVRIEYIYDKSNMPLGTSGAISSLRKIIKNTFIVTSGDILRDLDINLMLSFHQKNKPVATINIYRRKRKYAKSLVITGKNFKIRKFIERPHPEIGDNDYIWSNGSFYFLEPEVFDFIPENSPSDFGRDIFPSIISSGYDVFAYPSDKLFIDIGHMRSLKMARRLFSGK